MTAFQELHICIALLSVISFGIKIALDIGRLEGNQGWIQ